MLCCYGWRCSTSAGLCNRCVDVHRPLLYLLILLKLHTHYPLDRTYGPRQTGHFGTVDHTPGNYGSAPWEWPQYTGTCTKGQPLLCVPWLHLNISCMQTMWEMLGINALVDNVLELQIKVSVFGSTLKVFMAAIFAQNDGLSLRVHNFLLVFLHNSHNREWYKNVEWFVSSIKNSIHSQYFHPQ